MKWLSLLIAVVLVLCLVPLAYGADVGVTGKFTTKPVAPIVEALEIYQDKGCSSIATSMTPQIEYYAKATITQKSGLKYLKTVELYIYYDADGGDREPGSPHPQTCAKLTWTAEPENWSIDAGGSMTWQIVPSDCSRPANLNDTTGYWVFAFKPGKVATQSIAPSDWDGKAIATNKSDKTGHLYVRDKGMNWYGEVTVATASVDWGEVDTPLMFGQSPNPKGGIGATYIANGNYRTTIKGEDWAGGGYTAVLDESCGNPPGGANHFALKANDTNDLDHAVCVKKSEDVTVNNSGTQTSEDGVTVSTNTLWLALNQDFEAAEYQGNIYYGIANR